ncbi:GTP cyclohydrolase FolE2 [Amphibacillus jilinensis]|uniref:GTP cyclohydrolase FolE2 n=1 Tax=Amphibacillus jilinensis TaxID=1216008 RepID=UPI0002E11877|nr:GTP cyclohydrolase FolE2 [Amphibacillus jilinensis]
MTNHQSNYRNLPNKTDRHRLFGSVEPGEKNKPTKKEDMPDLQNTQNDFLFKLDAVGITNVKHPIQINSKYKPNQQSSLGVFTFSSSVKQDSKGTNMSRFTEQLQDYYNNEKLTLDLHLLKRFTKDLAERLHSSDAFLKVDVPWFYERRGPNSDLAGLNHAKLMVSIHFTEPHYYQIKVGLTGTVTTLCPCSKEISEYSAHNQRGQVQMEIELADDFDEQHSDWKVLLLEAAESNASARIHPVLKRPDEKMVTEQAYENPRFVEDMVRLVAADLYESEDIVAFKVTCQNEESIHLHDALASISFDKRVD